MTASRLPLAERLLVLWWQQVPSIADRASPAAGDLLRDGAYLAAWRRVAASAPPLALGLGFAAGVLRFGAATVFTESALVVILGLIAGFLAVPLGLAFVLGFAAADFLVYDHRILDPVVAGRVGLLMTYLAFALLVVAGPVLVSALNGTVPEAGPLGWLGVRAGIAAALATAVLFAAVQPVPLLIRPLFVWSGRPPTVQAMDLVQRAIWLIAGAGAVTATTRVLLEAVAWDRDPAIVIDVAGVPSRLAGRARPRLPASVRAVLTALVGTLLLAGVVQTWVEAAVLFAGLLAIAALRTLGVRALPAWPRQAERVPLPVRLVLVLAASYWLSDAVLGDRSWGVSFMPLIAAFLLSLVVAAVAFPPPPSHGASAGPTSRRSAAPDEPR